MQMRFNDARLFVVFLGFVFCLYEPLYAQRAGVAVERNNDVQEINELYEQGRWEEGKKRAEGEVRKNPRDSDMRMLLGKYYLNRKMYDKARYELVKSLEYAPANVDSKHMLVTVETETQRYSSAICYINELLEVNPYWKGLWRKKIELYRITNNHVEADRLLRRISQIYPEDSELQADKAYVMQERSSAIMKSGKLNESIEIGRKLVDDQPHRTDSYMTVIDNYIKAGDYNNALVYTERGLNQFPGNAMFVQKKVAILEHQQRYSELLGFLDVQIKRGGNAALRSQYSYFLLEAARNAKGNSPATLYGKVFDAIPSHKEAFDYVFNNLVAEQQYEEALHVLGRHRNAIGGSKELDMKELSLYKRMGNEPRVAALTREYFVKYPNDPDLQEDFVVITSQRAKVYMEEGKIDLAIADWRDVIRYGDHESADIARRGLYNAYVSEKRYQDAILILDDMLLDTPQDITLLIKKADMYYQQGRYEYALTIYEQILELASPQDRERHVIAYGEFVSPVIKNLRDSYRLEEAKRYAERWLAVDARNQEALLAVINLCYQMNDKEGMLSYAQKAEEYHSDDVAFKIKLAEAMNHRPEQLPDSWALLLAQVRLNSFHEPLINTFSHTTEEYAAVLLKAKDHELALSIIDTALQFKKDQNKELKYLKGLAYEGLKQYDSAYYYQGFYEPSLMEFETFKQHLDYLGQRSFKNTVGFAHLRARYGDHYAITSISTAEYTRLVSDKEYWVARANYAGREEGKGMQGQAEWGRTWMEGLSSRVDLALANKFFSKLAINAAGIYEWKPTWEAEVGLGYRRFFSGENLANLNLGVAKELDDWRLSARLGNFLLDTVGGMNYLYSLMGRVEYHLENPKNYVMVIGSVGNTPDVDLLDRQLYNSFNVFNAMVGGGIGRSFTKNISGNVVGTWYNFQVDSTFPVAAYRNLYNLYFQLNVSF